MLPSFWCGMLYGANSWFDFIYYKNPNELGKG